MTNIFELLGTDSCVIVSKDSCVFVSKQLIKMFGTKVAYMASELYAEYRWCKENNQLNDEGGFCSDIENDPVLTEKERRKAIKTLQDENILTIKKQGIPAKNYFYINVEKLKELKVSLGIDLH